MSSTPQRSVSGLRQSSGAFASPAQRSKKRQGTAAVHASHVAHASAGIADRSRHFPGAFRSVPIAARRFEDVPRPVESRARIFEAGPRKVAGEFRPVAGHSRSFELSPRNFEIRFRNCENRPGRVAPAPRTFAGPFIWRHLCQIHGFRAGGTRRCASTGGGNTPLKPNFWRQKHNQQREDL